MTLSAASLRFPRASRIRRGSDFRRTQALGNRVVCGCLIANWRALEAGGAGRLGVVASRRIGAAVVRNRARRLLKEVYRLNRAAILKPVDLVLVARKSIASSSFQEVRRDLLRAMRSAGLAA